MKLQLGMRSCENAQIEILARGVFLFFFRFHFCDFVEVVIIHHAI